MQNNNQQCVSKWVETRRDEPNRVSLHSIEEYLNCFLFFARVALRNIKNAFLHKILTQYKNGSLRFAALKTLSEFLKNHSKFKVKFPAATMATKERNQTKLTVFQEYELEDLNEKARFLPSKKWIDSTVLLCFTFYLFLFLSLFFLFLSGSGMPHFMGADKSESTFCIFMKTTL